MFAFVSLAFRNKLKFKKLLNISASWWIFPLILIWYDNELLKDAENNLLCLHFIFIFNSIHFSKTSKVKRIFYATVSRPWLRTTRKTNNIIFKIIMVSTEHFRPPFKWIVESVVVVFLSFSWIRSYFWSMCFTCRSLFYSVCMSWFWLQRISAKNTDEEEEEAKRDERKKN